MTERGAVPGNRFERLEIEISSYSIRNDPAGEGNRAHVGPSIILCVVSAANLRSCSTKDECIVVSFVLRVSIVSSLCFDCLHRACISSGLSFSGRTK